MGYIKTVESLAGRSFQGMYPPLSGVHSLRPFVVDFSVVVIAQCPYLTACLPAPATKRNPWSSAGLHGTSASHPPHDLCAHQAKCQESQD